MVYSISTATTVVGPSGGPEQGPPINASYDPYLAGSAGHGET